MISLTNNFYGKKSSAFASILSLYSWGNSYLFLLKYRTVFSRLRSRTTTRLSLHTGLTLSVLYKCCHLASVFATRRFCQICLSLSFTSISTVISSPSRRRTRHDRVLVRPSNGRGVGCVAAAAVGAAGSSVGGRPPSSKSTDRLSRAGGGGWSAGSSRTDATSRPCCDHCCRRRRHSAWFFSTFIDDVDDDGATPGRRRPALGDWVTGDRADRPPLRDGIVDQLAVVASSGVRASDSPSLASVGTSCIPPPLTRCSEF